MKILLIPPTVNYKHHYPSFVSSCFFPTGFAYIASSLLNAGHNVHGLNLNNVVGYVSAKTMITHNITVAINDFEPDLIGVGGLCTDYAFIKDAIEIIRYINPRIKIVVGGGIVNNDAEFIFKLLHPDFCVVGEGEEIIVKLVEEIEGNHNYAIVSNIGYWDDGIPKFTQQDFNYCDINLRAFPDYNIFENNVDDYVLTSAWWYRYSRPYPKIRTIITARSCPFSCSFCVHERGPKYRARSVDSIMEEIKITYEKYGFNILVMMDELFAVNKKRIHEFCNALISAKSDYGWDFDWSFQTHASASFDRETLELAKSSGCTSFSYGLESASQGVLESMNKKTTPSQIMEAINLANDVGIGFGGNLIFGDLAETEITVKESLSFLMQNCPDANIMLAALRPYPGSKIFEVCLERGLIKDKTEFYEHIDENPWNMTVNMTRMPNRTWLPLLDSIVAFGQLFPWVKNVYPYYCEEDFGVSDSAVVKYTGKQVHRVWAHCPHCGKDIHYRELLALRKGVAPAALILSADTHKGSFISRFISIFNLVIDAVSKAMRLSRMYYLSFTHPIYKLLKSAVRNKHDLLWESFFSTVFFVTGCTHCNKKIKIVIPIPLTIKAFSLTEIKRRFNLA